MKMLDKAVKAETIKPESQNYKIKALLLGDSKSGKTTSSLSLPGRKLLVDFDGRADSAAGVPNVDIIRILEEDPDKPKAWNQAVALRDEIWAAIKANSFNYDGVIWDGLSGMNKICMNFVLTLRTKTGQLAERGFGDTPAQHHYGPYMQEMSKFIFNCIAMPIHIVFTGHFYVYEDEHTNKLEWWPKLFGNIRTEVGSWFNEVYRTYTATEQRKEGNDVKKVQKYYWQTAADQRLGFLGSSLNQFGKYWTSPVELDPNERPWGFEKLIALRFSNRS